MPHATFLALEANWFAAIVALLSASIWLVLWQRSRQGYSLACALGWMGLCAYWSLIAISAGPAPWVSRDDVALPVRALLIVSMGAMLAGKGVFLWRAWRLGRCDST